MARSLCVLLFCWKQLSAEQLRWIPDRWSRIHHGFAPSLTSNHFSIFEMASIRLKWRVPLRGEIQWANVSTTLTKKPFTCARSIKSTSVSCISVVVTLVGTVNTDPHVWYGSWKGRRRLTKVLGVFISQDLKICLKPAQSWKLGRYWLLVSGCWFEVRHNNV